MDESYLTAFNKEQIDSEYFSEEVGTVIFYTSIMHVSGLSAFNSR